MSANWSAHADAQLQKAASPQVLRSGGLQRQTAWTHLTLTRLWDGSEPGWVVVRRTEDREQLTLEFGSSGPTLDEVKALRTLQSDYRSRPVGEVLASLRGKSSLFLGTFESREARSLKKRCAEVGLQVTAIGARWVSLNLINRLSSTFLLIEDDREIGEVAEEAIRRGVPVEESTT